MRTGTYAALCALFVTAVALAACSGGNVVLTPKPLVSSSPQGSAKPTTSPTSSATPTPAPSASSSAGLSLALDQQIVTNAQAYYATLSHTDAGSDAAAMATYLANQPGVASAGSTPFAAMAEFSDGLAYVVHLDQDALGLTSEGVSAPMLAPAEHRRSSGTRRRDALYPTPTSFTQLPQGGTIYVLANQTAYQSDAAEQGIASAFNAAGYVAAFKDASVGAFMNLINAEGLYVLTHGAVFDRPGFPPFYALATSDTVPSAWSQIPTAYQQWLKGTPGTVPQLYIASIPIESQGGALQQVYGVTNAFFASQPNISFLSNAFAFVNACQSDDYADTGLQSFLTTLKSRGVATYLGWTKEASITDSRETANFFFDRWLGEQNPSVTNAFVGVPTPESSPPERPFSLDEVFDYGQSYGRQDGNTALGSSNETLSCLDQNKAAVQGPSNGCFSELNSSIGGTAEDFIVNGLILAPSIETATVDEVNNVITLYGEFDAKPGTVSIGVTPSDTTSYSQPAMPATQGQVQAPIPPKGTGSAGYVTVTNDGIASNVVPLTLWGPLDVSQTYASSGGGATSSATAQGAFSFRADVHPYRTMPGANAQAAALQQASGSSALINVLQSSTSSLSLTFSYLIGAPPVTTSGTAGGTQPWCPFSQPVGAPAYPCTTPPNSQPNYFIASIAVPCVASPAGTSPLCLLTNGYAPGSQAPCPPAGFVASCAGDAIYGFGLDSVVPLSFDTTYDIGATSGSPPFIYCSLEWGGAQIGASGTCPYTSQATPATYPPLSTTPG